MSQAAASLALLDTAARRQEYIFGVPNLVQGSVKSTLNDPRDAPALYLLFNVCCLVVPGAVLLHLLPEPPHWLGAAYFVTTYGLFLQRFMLTLHFTQHRPLFKPGGAGSVGNLVAPYLLAPLFGLPPGAYHLHHCAMHHAQGNAAPGDASSTEPYQRDSAPAFLRYWLRFALLGGPDLVAYASRVGRRGTAARCAACLVVYWGAVGAGLAARPVAATWVLLVPYLVSSLALMFGNWSQHIFINPAAPRHPYGLAYTCAACPDNAATYNDGYHATHHTNSRTHWSDLPRRWADTLEEQDTLDALVFRGIGFFEVGAAVMAGRLAWLADHIVPCGPRQARRNRQEWVEELRRRLGPVGASSSKCTAAVTGAGSTGAAAAAALGSKAVAQVSTGAAAVSVTAGEGTTGRRKSGKAAAAAS